MQLLLLLSAILTALGGAMSGRTPVTPQTEQVASASIAAVREAPAAIALVVAALCFAIVRRLGRAVPPLRVAYAYRLYGSRRRE